MRNVIAFLIALGLVAAIFWWTRSSEKAAPPATQTASGSSPAAAEKASAAPTVTTNDKVDTTKVRKLDRAARKQLGEQIIAAREHARASASAAGAPPALETLTLEDVGAPLQDKLREALPLLAECFEQRAQKVDALAMMTLMTDPELGTVIDTDAIKDAAGDPLAPELDACLRDAIDSLALPPLGPKGGTLPLQYTFVFD